MKGKRNEEEGVDRRCRGKEGNFIMLVILALGSEIR